MKRLANRLTSEAEADAERELRSRLNDLAPGWRRLGISAGDILMLSYFVNNERLAFERSLDQMDSDRPNRQKNLKELRSAINKARPLLDLLAKLNPKCADDVSTTIAAYRSQLRAAIRHNPGDPWMRGPVLMLALDMKRKRPSIQLARIAQELATIFRLWGHRDRVTAEKIRYILRTAIKNDPDFADRFNRN